MSERDTFTDIDAALRHADELMRKASGEFDQAAFVAAMKERIVGQDAVIDGIADILQDALSRKNRKAPVSIFLVGKAGLGKTEFAKALADILTPGTGLVTFEMEKYKTVQTFQPAFFGSDSVWKDSRPGKLASALQQNSKRVLLIDEFDKITDLGIADMFLTVLQEGRLTDEHSRTEIRLKDAVFVFTANWGHERLEDQMAKVTDPTQQAGVILEELVKVSGVGPWFFGRLTGVYVLRSPSKADFLMIAGRQMRALARSYGLHLVHWEPEAAGAFVRDVWNQRQAGVRAVDGVLRAHGYARLFKHIQREEGTDEDDDPMLGIVIGHDPDGNIAVDTLPPLEQAQLEASAQAQIEQIAEAPMPQLSAPARERPAQQRKRRPEL